MRKRRAIVKVVKEICPRVVQNSIQRVEHNLMEEINAVAADMKTTKKSVHETVAAVEKAQVGVDEIGTRVQFVEEQVRELKQALKKSKKAVKKAKRRLFTPTVHSYPPPKHAPERVASAAMPPATAAAPQYVQYDPRNVFRDDVVYVRNGTPRPERNAFTANAPPTRVRSKPSTLSQCFGRRRVESIFPGDSDLLRGLEENVPPRMAPRPRTIALPHKRRASNYEYYNGVRVLPLE